MKQSRNRQYQKKVQSLLGSLVYQVARGNIKNEFFSSSIQQIYGEITKASLVDPEMLNNSFGQIQLDKLPKTAKLKKKYIQYLKTYQQYAENQEQSSDEHPVTIGQIVVGWAGLTGQDETDFETRVYPQIKKLIVKRYKATGYLGFTDNEVFANPESTANFIIDLVNILIEETSIEKKAAFVDQMKAALITTITHSGLEIDIKVLKDASEKFTSETITQTKEILTSNPTAKDRLLKPLFGQLVAIEAQKYGWECNIPVDNSVELQSAFLQHGVSSNERIIARALKKLGRKSLLQNINDALNNKLNENLNNIFSESMNNYQEQTQSIWEFSPVSLDDDKEIEKTIREWLFRGDKKWHQ